ncbi:MULTISPECIES: hypothetical protein [unclassified Methylobacterium]|uniref:hypothetical protein n=1 Tax=unclassified Methylobacterium TaxID=2615210 RepID=UPI000A48EA4C|nr:MULTISPECIES: hypothetical protein [unclassified Methylobacterium]
MVERVLTTIRQWGQIAWWDGSCLDLRLHRLAGFIDRDGADPALAPAREVRHGR